MQVVIVDYGSGNLRSALKAFERAAREAGVAATITLSADADHVAKADRVVLPGVGAYADCRAGLDAVRRHERDALNEAVVDKAGRSSASASACS
jgi:glutamine amidotransferase